MDINKIREDFPVIKNREIVYLDSATSTLVPHSVIKAMTLFYEENGAVSKRGVYKSTIEATEQYQQARIKVAEFFKVSPGTIAFVPNESYGINTLIYSLKWEKGDRIITSLLEHHSNFLPILYVKGRFGVELDYMTHSSEGRILSDSLLNLIKPETKLVSITYSPLLFGTISPIKEIVKIAHEQGRPVLLDGTRISGHYP
ncbi:MAG: aminotransferase class V-fold PLP-dependent enzyme, partial [Candidatus Helarchaeota archaeon]